MSNYNGINSDQSVYRNVFDLMKSLHLPDGIHLDLGCGYAANPVKTFEIGLIYVGIDKDPSTIAQLTNDGIEAYQLDFENSDNPYQQIRSIIGDRKISIISAIDVVDCLIDTNKFISFAHQVSLGYQAPLIVNMPNISHWDASFKLFTGTFYYTASGLLDQKHLKYLTEQHLNEALQLGGFDLTEKSDFELEYSDQFFPKDNIALASGTLINQYFRWLKNILDPNACVHQFIRVDRPVPLPRAK